MGVRTDTRVTLRSGTLYFHGDLPTLRRPCIPAVERANATLKTWKILTRLRCRPSRATAITKATLVLQTIHDQR